MKMRLNDAVDADQPSVIIALARKILENEPEDGIVWAQLGYGLYLITNCEEAEIAYMKALEFCDASNEWAIYSRLGDLSQDCGDYTKAKTWYQKCIDKTKNNAHGYIDLGAALASQGKFKEAEEAHRYATGCSDGCIDEAFCNLGLVIRAQGRLEEAEECFTKALEIDPEYKVAQEALDDVQKAIAIKSEK